MSSTARLCAVFFGLGFQTAGWCGQQSALPALKVEVTQDLRLGKQVYNWAPSWSSPFRRVATLEPKKFTQESHGTAWATEFHDKLILVTAGHVIGTCGEVNFSPENKTKAELAELAEYHPVSRISRVVLGGVGGKPIRIGTLSDDADIALVVPHSDAVFSGLKVFKLANRLPSLFESVRALGFPHGAHFAKQEQTTVTTVVGAKGYFVLNIPLNKGFSGGVVLDENGLALGVITSIDETSTTVMALNRILLEQFKFDEAKRVLTKQYPLPPPTDK